MRVIVIHGTCGSPEINWFPWLKNQLRDRGIACLVPRFPTPEQQNLQNWLTTFHEAVGNLEAQDILVGHSIGAGFVCRVLESSELTIRAAFLVSGFARQLGNPDFDPFNKSFVEEPFDWQKVRSHARQFQIYAGDNDPYVPLAYGKELASALSAHLEVVPSGGHLNAESGFVTFPLLLEALVKVQSVCD